MHDTIERRLYQDLSQKMTYAPVCAILGPRQCGKTTLADMYGRENPTFLKLDLERPSDLRKLDDPESFFSENRDRLICIDEIQRKQDLFPVIRYITDKESLPGQFLILGSASRDLIRQSSESLAGRISYLELTPFLHSEINQHIRQLHSRGGFPRSYLAESDRQSLEWRLNFVRDFLERDIPFMSSRLSPEVISRLLQMLGHCHGQLLNMSTIARSLGVDNMSVKRYLDLLEGAFIIRKLLPYYGNLKKRLVKSPKIYIRDSGILHALLQIPDWNGLVGHPVYGFSWESFCIENIIPQLKPEIRYSFYRTSNGGEIDLILETASEKIALEFKVSSAPKPEKGFGIALDDLGIGRAWVIAPLEDGYTIGNIRYSPLSQFIGHSDNRDIFR